MTVEQSMLEIVESDALTGWRARSPSLAPSLVFHLFNEKTFERQYYSLCGNWFKRSLAPSHTQRFCKNCARIARKMYEENQGGK